MKITMTAIALILISLLAVDGSFASGGWSWAFIASSNEQNSSTGGMLGVDPLSSDGYDSSDKFITTGPRAYFAVYHRNDEPGWEGNGGFYRYDKRAGFQTQAGTQISWQVNVWADLALAETASQIYIDYWPVDVATTGTDVWLTLVSKPAEITGGPGVGTQWHLSSTPEGKIALPIFRTANGLDGYIFDLTATVVPEPSALAALGAGLVGVVVRRKRR